MRKLALVIQSWGPLGAFVLAALDSAGIPLPGGVDAMILLVAATNPILAWETALVCVVGSLIGCMVLFSIARKGGEIYLAHHTQSERSRRFRDWFQHYGLVTVFIPAAVPVPMPLKVFVLSAGALGVHPRSFLVVVAAARTPRYFALAWLGKSLGEGSVDWLRAHAVHLGLFAAALLAGSYLLIRYFDRRRGALQ